MASNQPDSSPVDTFRLAFIGGKIKELFKSLMVKAVLLTELREMDPDAELIVKLLDKIQPVKPIQLPKHQPNVNQAALAVPPRVMDGGSEDTALEVVDSEDELVNDMVLTQRQEQRSGGTDLAVVVQINEHLILVI